jgi:hypothetical protein
VCACVCAVLSIFEEPSSLGSFIKYSRIKELSVPVISEKPLKKEELTTFMKQSEKKRRRFSGKFFHFFPFFFSSQRTVCTDTGNRFLEWVEGVNGCICAKYDNRRVYFLGHMSETLASQ